MGVYVHVPFCEHKCYYCDFYSIVVGSGEGFTRLADSYLLSLRKEALYYKDLWDGPALTSLFIGGGTPSVLPGEKLAELIAFLLDTLPFVPDPEVTIEANPNSLTPDKAEALAQAGVNRVSLGVQAFQEELLSAVGRLHRLRHIEESIAWVREAGITNLSLDLMFGLPGQSMDQWEETLLKALSFQPNHLSCYGLILEPDTPLTRWWQQGLVELPDDDLQADQYLKARTVLTAAGYEHYEISNFCLPGDQSRHNLLYWHNRPFLGLGPAAAGYFKGRRYTNTPDLQAYLGAWQEGRPAYSQDAEVSLEQEMDETMMVGMRLLAGVSEQAFRERYQVSFWDVYGEAITDLAARNLVEYQDGFLRVTEEGLLLENLVSGAFLR